VVVVAAWSALTGIRRAVPATDRSASSSPVAGRWQRDAIEEAIGLLGAGDRPAAIQALLEVTNPSPQGGGQ